MLTQKNNFSYADFCIEPEQRALVEEILSYHPTSGGWLCLIFPEKESQLSSKNCIWERACKSKNNQPVQSERLLESLAVELGGFHKHSQS